MSGADLLDNLNVISKSIVEELINLPMMRKVLVVVKDDSQSP